MAISKVLKLLEEPITVLLEEAEQVTGIPVDVRQGKKDMVSPACVDVGIKDKHPHIIIIRPDLLLSHDQLQYYFTHELGHVFRIQDMLGKERLCDNPDVRKIAIAELSLDLDQRYYLFHKKDEDRRLKICFETVCSVINSAVQDLWVNEWYKSRFGASDIGECQRTVIEEFFEDYFNDRSTDTTFNNNDPRCKRWVDILKTVRYVFCRLTAEELLELEGMTEPFLKYPKVVESGEDLVRITKSSERESYEDDIALVGKWADVLCVRRWFYWETVTDV